MGIRKKAVLSALKELGIGVLLGMVGWLLGGSFGTIFILTLIIRRIPQAEEKDWGGHEGGGEDIIRIKPILKELGMAFLLGFIGYILGGSFGTIFILVLLIRYTQKKHI